MLPFAIPPLYDRIDISFLSELILAGDRKSPAHHSSASRMKEFGIINIKCYGDVGINTNSNKVREDVPNDRLWLARRHEPITLSDSGPVR